MAGTASYFMGTAVRLVPVLYTRGAVQFADLVLHACTPERHWAMSRWVVLARSGAAPVTVARVRTTSSHDGHRQTDPLTYSRTTCCITHFRSARHLRRRALNFCNVLSNDYYPLSNLASPVAWPCPLPPAPCPATYHVHGPWPQTGLRGHAT